MSVVLPDDSGPNTSTMRPRGTPPTPSARSSDSAPVGTAATRTWAASSPIFMIDPAPKARSPPLGGLEAAFAVLRAHARQDRPRRVPAHARAHDLHRLARGPAGGLA